MPSLKDMMMSEYGLDEKEAKLLIDGYMANHKDDPAAKDWDAIKYDMDIVISLLSDNIHRIDARTNVAHEIFECGKDRQKNMIDELCTNCADTADSFLPNNYHENVRIWAHALVHASSYFTENKMWDTYKNYEKWTRYFDLPSNPARTAEVLGLETKVVGMIAAEGSVKDFQYYMTEKAPYLDEADEITGWRTTKLPNKLTNRIFASLQDAVKEGTYEYFSRRETVNGFWKVLNCKDLTQDDKQMITSAMTQEIGKGHIKRRADAAISLFQDINTLNDCTKEQRQELKEMAVKDIGENWPVRGQDQEGLWESAMDEYYKHDLEGMQNFLDRIERGREESIDDKHFQEKTEIAKKAAEEIRDGIFKLVQNKTADGDNIHAVINDTLEKYNETLGSDYHVSYNTDALFSFNGNIVPADGIGEIFAAAGVREDKDIRLMASFNEKEKIVERISEINSFMKEAFLGKDEHAAEMLADKIRDGHPQVYENLPEAAAAALIAATKEYVHNEPHNHDNVENLNGDKMVQTCVHAIGWTNLDAGWQNVQYGILGKDDWKGICSSGMMTMYRDGNRVKFNIDIESISKAYRCINHTILTSEEKSEIKELVSKELKETLVSERKNKAFDIFRYADIFTHYTMPDAYDHLKSYIMTGHENTELNFFAMNIDPSVILNSAIEKYKNGYPDLPQPSESRYEEEDKRQPDGSIPDTTQFSFNFGSGGSVAFYYWDGAIHKRTPYFDERHQNNLCAQAMSVSLMSAISEHRYIRDEKTKDAYEHAMDLADEVNKREGSEIENSFVRFNPEGHMELIMIPKHDDRAEVCMDMETGEVWAEKDGEILSEFDRTMKYTDLDKIFNATMDVLTCEEEFRNELESEIDMGEQEQENHEEDLDIAD